VLLSLFRGVFKIHAEPIWPQDHANTSSTNVLGNLRTLFVGKLFDLYVVAFDFCLELSASKRLILSLNGCDWLRIAPSAASQSNQNCYESDGAHLIAPNLRLIARDLAVWNF
jgi:hypothetical protein